MKKKNLTPVVYAALYLNKKTAAEKVAFGTNILNSMTSNLNFSTPVPTLVEYQATITDLADALAAAVDGTPTEKSNVAVTESAFDFETRRMRDYVENTALMQAPDIAKMIIESAGMSVSKTPERNPLPEQPALTAKFTNVAGTVKLIVKAGRYSKMFNVYQRLASSDPTTYVLVAQSSKRSITVGGLTSGTRYTFKVVPKGTAGEGPDSNEASQLAA